MAKLAKEQLQKIKKQLMKQISGLPSKQQQDMKAQIESMNDDELEEFLIKNKMIQTESESPFRMIIDNKLPSYKIAEIPKAIAVLEINPISVGHIIIIPKIPTKANQISEEILNFSKSIAEHLKEKLNCKDVIIGAAEIFDEGIINLLPVYKDEDLNSKRKKASEEELKELQEKLISKSEPKKTIKKPAKKRKTPINRLPKAPRRIP